MFNQRRPDPAPGGDSLETALSPHSAFDMFTTELRTAGATATLRMSGEVDLSVEDRMREGLEALLGSEAETLVIDLEDLDYMDSTGVQRLLAAQAAADAAGRRLRVRLGEAARRVLDLCGVMDRFTQAT